MPRCLAPACRCRALSSLNLERPGLNFTWLSSLGARASFRAKRLAAAYTLLNCSPGDWPRPPTMRPSRSHVLQRLAACHRTSTSEWRCVSCNNIWAGDSAPLTSGGAVLLASRPFPFFHLRHSGSFFCSPSPDMSINLRRPFSCARRGSSTSIPTTPTSCAHV